MQIRITILIFFLAAGLALRSQESGHGHLVVIQDPRVDSLVSAFIAYNKSNPHIEGWRVEIFFEAGNYSKKLAMEAKVSFVQKYPDIPSYILFQQPYYKVRVGDFLTKLEAEKLLKKIEKDYPNGFVVTDEINFPRLE